MLCIDQLSVDFPVQGGSIRPVDHICLEVSENRRHVIVGETGSGKSVLLATILGLAGGRVQGSIRWNDRELVGLGAREFARLRGSEIAYIPQGNASGMNPLIRNGHQIGEPLIVHRGVTRRMAFRQAQRVRQAKLGCAPAHKLFELVQVQKKEGVEHPRSYRDYDAIVHLDRVPRGVQIGFKADAFSEIRWDSLPESEEWFING